MAQNSSLLNTVPVEDLSVCNAPLPHATPEFGDTTIIAHLLSPQLQCSSKPDLAEMTSTSGPSIPTVHSDLPSHSIALLLQNISHLHARLSSAEVSARSWQAGFMALQSPARTIPSVTPLYLCSPSSSSSTSTKDLCSRCDAELGSAHNAIHDRYQSMVTVALQARRAAHDFKQLARYWERRARKTEAQFGKASDTSITPSASDVSEVSTSEILDPIRTQAVRELLARRAAAAPVDGNSDTTDLGPNFVQSAVEDHLARVQAAISPIPDSGSASSSSTVHALEDTALTLETKKQDALQADAQSLVPDTPSVVGTQHPNPIPALHPPPNKSTRRATSTRAHAGCIAPSALKTPKKVVTQRSHSEHVVKVSLSLFWLIRELRSCFPGCRSSTKSSCPSSAQLFRKQFAHQHRGHIQHRLSFLFASLWPRSCSLVQQRSLCTSKTFGDRRACSRRKSAGGASAASVAYRVSRNRSHCCQHPFYSFGSSA
jgi:hypothetical protein